MRERNNLLDARDWRYSVYLLLVGCSLAATTARIATVVSPDGKTPFLSANDRSRWSTVVALVDDGTYVIDRFQKIRTWQTIDKVWHPGTDGEHHFYSSKPPLLATLVAGEYWLLQRATGVQFERHPFYVARSILWLTNGGCLILFFWCLVQLVERWGSTDWGRVFVVAAASWGTFLTTFAVTLNNHLPAAVCVIATLYLGTVLHDKNSPLLAGFVGVAAAMTVACELPALSFFAIVSVAILWRRSFAESVAFLCGAGVVVVAYFVTNYLAHQDWRPAYAHREWYDYPGSYWTAATRPGTDRGEPSRWVYALHLLVGHHGIFSLTPIWLMVLPTIAHAFRNRSRDLWWWLAAVTSVLAIVCTAFYIARPEIDRNYGGVTSGFRWMFWFIPLWLLLMLPTLDRYQSSRVFRYTASLLLCLAVFSAAYGWANPWVHPWPYRWGVFQAWIAP